MTHIRDPRTKTSWSRTEPTKYRTWEIQNLGNTEPRTEPDQNREKFQNLGPDQDQENFPNVGPNRTRTEKNFKTWDRTMTTKILKIPVPGPVDPWCGSKTILFRD